MRTIRLLLEYDGTDFSGWQLQSGEESGPTIQGELERALLTLTQETIRVRAASRTDAGVHARGQIAAFETERDRIPEIGFARGLNTMLPKSIVVRQASAAAAGYQPRRTSRGKRYRYTFWNDPQPSALDRRFAWFVRPKIELARIEAALPALLGTHDFEAFRSTGCTAKHAIRTLYELGIRRGDYSRVHLDVVGNAFCRNMVRILAGTLRDVGIGKLPPEAVAEILASRDRTRAGMTAPPNGLCLEEVIEDDRLPPRPDQIPTEDEA